MRALDSRSASSCFEKESMPKPAMNSLEPRSTQRATPHCRISPQRCATRSRINVRTFATARFRLSSSRGVRVEIQSKFSGGLMFKKYAALTLVVAAAALAACGGNGGGAASGAATSYVLPGMGDLKFTATLPNGTSSTVSEELPGEGIGTVKDSHWQATLGGYTQQQFAQALGFPTGT